MARLPDYRSVTTKSRRNSRREKRAFCPCANVVFVHQIPTFFAHSIRTTQHKLPVCHLPAALGLTQAGTAGFQLAGQTASDRPPTAGGRGFGGLKARAIEPTAGTHSGTEVCSTLFAPCLGETDRIGKRPRLVPVR
jgi:hypothetical protein